MVCELFIMLMIFSMRDYFIATLETFLRFWQNGMSIFSQSEPDHWFEIGHGWRIVFKRKLEQLGVKEDERKTPNLGVVSRTFYF